MAFAPQLTVPPNTPGLAAETRHPASVDPFGRSIDYLRISVTDRCNERCLYCMPEGYRGWERTPDPLSAEEILRVVRVAADMGFRKFRLTGGEPLVRRDLPEIVHAMAAIPGVESIGLSTNGIRLSHLAQALHHPKLRSINVSLDALDSGTYRRVTGGEVHAVLSGIQRALAAGFECVKLNCVLMRGISEHQLWPLVHYAADHGLPLRLVELMPLTSADALSREHFFPLLEAMDLLKRRDELVPQPHRRVGWGPAKYYLLPRAGVLVGFIGALTNPHFCETCNKLRLTADGKLRPCLGNHGELDLRATLRQLDSDEAVRQMLAAAILRKPLTHDFNAQYQPCRPMTAIGG